MKPLYFLAGLFISFAGITWFAHRTVTSTVASQKLSTYIPDSTPHVVFLGSSLTDQKIQPVLLDSLLAHKSVNLRSFNLALAGMFNDEFSYFLIKKWILPRSRPAAIALEIRDFPFIQQKKDFSLEGGGRNKLLLMELMDYSDYQYVSQGFPGIINSFNFFLHKNWFVYHHRLNIQWKITERLSLQPKFIKLTKNYGMRKSGYQVIQAWVQGMIEEKKKTDISIKNILSNDRYFSDILTLIKENGIQLILFKPPYPPGDELLRNNPVFLKHFSHIQHICDSLDVMLWDFTEPPDGVPWTFADKVHLDEESYMRYTHHIAEKIVLSDVVSQIN